MRVLVAVVVAAVLTGCRGGSGAPVEDLSHVRDLSRFALTSLRGTRDGDRLDVQASFGDGAGGELRTELRFVVGVPATKLASGTWTGLGGSGAVRERSTTFLGGQDGPPSIGGRYDLVGPDGSALYRVNIPLQQLKKTL